MKRIMLISGLLVLATLAAGGVAVAQHGDPPRYVGLAPVFGVTISVESTGGEVYHDNASNGTSGTSCTTTTADDGTTDDAKECYNDRTQLRNKNVSAAEGGAANCALAPGQNVNNQVVFDGVWLDECGAPSDAKGRVYTGVAVAGAGNGGLAAGGDATTQSGCVQAFGEDDTAGNSIKMVTDSLQSAGGTPHSGTDDDADVALCGDVM